MKKPAQWRALCSGYCSEGYRLRRSIQEPVTTPQMIVPSGTRIIRSGQSSLIAIKNCSPSDSTWSRLKVARPSGVLTTTSLPCTASTSGSTWMISPSRYSGNMLFPLTFRQNVELLCLNGDSSHSSASPGASWSIASYSIPAATHEISGTSPTPPLVPSTFELSPERRLISPGSIRSEADSLKTFAKDSTVSTPASVSFRRTRPIVVCPTPERSDKRVCVPNSADPAIRNFRLLASTWRVDVISGPWKPRSQECHLWLAMCGLLLLALYGYA
ncbi:hypothetical protein EV691_13543 [Azotobacter chroococcum]|uniref:Uncharacterized protein n=1 Tax=Azotobacter chroococcum TaxID=353 RepID=A0A4R1P864_9GAMM|nr:hypothetical protein EV691_13543 [Azotobacter chroococcum]